MLLEVCAMFLCRVSIVFCDAPSFSALQVQPLPRDLLPVIYRIAITLESPFQISAKSSIELFAVNSTRKLVFHANCQWLTIKETVINQPRNGNFTLPHPIMDVENEIITYILPDEKSVKKNDYFSVYFVYSARLNMDKIQGLFVKRKDQFYHIGTQFEQTFARNLFPCLDEPLFKAVYQLSVQLQGSFGENSSYQVLSTTPNRQENLKWTFEPTPPMPSYIFGFAISRFDSDCHVVIRNVGEICVWFSEGFSKSSVSVGIAHVASRAQAFFTDLLAEQLPTQIKLDFLIAPLRALGMEHWGLLTLNDNVLLENYSNWTMFAKSKWALTVVHEVAHQWFGNLVTPATWDHVWLSESLSTYVTSLAVSSKDFDNLIPFLIKAKAVGSEAFYRAYNSNRPDRRSIKEIVLVADSVNTSLVSSKWHHAIPTLVYRKGPMILRMLQEVIGVHTMRSVLRNFLHEFSRRSATTDDFLFILNQTVQDNPFSDPFIELSNQTSVNVAAFFASWLYQPTYPIVFIDYDSRTKEFFLSQQVKDPTYAGKVQWLVPIWTPTGMDEVELHWLEPDKRLTFTLGSFFSHFNESSESATDIDWEYANRYGYFQIVRRY